MTQIVVNSFPDPNMQLFDANGNPVQVVVEQEEPKSDGGSSHHNHKSDRHNKK